MTHANAFNGEPTSPSPAVGHHASEDADTETEVGRVVSLDAGSASGFHRINRPDPNPASAPENDDAPPLILGEATRWEEQARSNENLPGGRPDSGPAMADLDRLQRSGVGLQEEDSDDDEDEEAAFVRQDVRKNDGIVVGVLKQTVRRMLDSHDLSPSYISQVVQTYALPDNIQVAIDRLRAHRVVVLVGDLHAGRHSAAVWLLHRCGGLELREVRRDPKDGFVTENLVTRKPTGWILDLRAVADEVALNFGRVLATSATLLQTASSYLVVVIRRDLWTRTKAGGEHLKVELDLAPPTAIVRNRLENAEPAVSLAEIERWLEHPDMRSRLSPLRPPEAVRWADAIRDEHFSPAPPGWLDTDEALFQTKIRHVIESQNSWRSDLLDWHRNNPDVRRRNFLLATALLEGATASEVYLAAEELRSSFQESVSSSPGQTGPGLLELLDDVKAHLAEDETISYGRTGFADAVLDYFWLDRMYLRERFMAWATGLPSRQDNRTAQVVADRVGQYALRIATRRDDLQFIEDAIVTWARGDHTSNAAETLMTAAALDVTLGPRMRAKMLDWAKADSDVSLKLVVARVCGGPAGILYPKVMIYRLAHLAKAPDAALRKSVGDALKSLWSRPELRERVRGQILQWLDKSRSPEQEAGRRAFSTLAALPDPSSGLPSVLVFDGKLDVPALTQERSFLIRGWRVLLDQREPAPEVDEAFALLMRVGLNLAEYKNDVLDILVKAVHGTDEPSFNAARRVRLDNLAFRWHPSTTEGYYGSRQALRDDLITLASRSDPMLNRATSRDSNIVKARYDE